MKNTWMQSAFEEAKEALAHDEVPVGAVVVKDGAIIGRGNNRVLRDCDSTAHAEIVALRQACTALGTHRLDGCDLYVTLEPCPMCASALAHARVHRVVYGAYDPKGGAIDHGVRLYDQPTCHHKPEVVGGVLEQDCAQLLQDFFMGKR